MMRWWAAFFVAGLVAPPVPAVEGAASLVLMGLGLWTFAWGVELRSLRRGCIEQQRRDLTIALCTMTCATAIVIWETAGFERMAHERAAASARIELSKAKRFGSPLGARDFARRQDSPSGIRSLSLVRARSVILAWLDDGRLTKRARGIVGALILDDRRGLDFTLSETYSYIGITHFLALSGLHLGVIAIPIAKIVSRLIRSRRASDAAVFAILCLYSAVAGLPASLLRALFLSAAIFAYRFLGLHTDIMDALIAGSLALVAIDQSVAFDAGFQLSFAAVCGIALIGIPIVRMLEPLLPGGIRGRALKTILYPALITCSVQFLTMPLVISLFKRSSLLSPLVNVIVSLPFTVLLYAGVLYVFIPFAPFRSILAHPINLLCRFLSAVPAVFSRAPHAALYPGDFAIEVYLCGVAFIAWSLRKSCTAKGRALSVGLACVIFAFLMPVVRGNRHTLVRTHCSVDAIAEMGLWSRKGSVYVPAGKGVVFLGDEFTSRESYRFTRELWSRGVRRIGYCVVTPSKLRVNHGLFYLVKRVSVDEVICSPYLLMHGAGILDRLSAGGCRVRAVTHGDSLVCEAWRLEILGPVYPPPAGGHISRAKADLTWRFMFKGRAGMTPLDFETASGYHAQP